MPWRMVMVVSTLLDPDEREVVRGDLLEAGDRGWRAVADVLGLVLRRQSEFLRPWLAACGPALVGALLLLGFSLSVSCTYEYQVRPVLSGALGVTLPMGMALPACHVLMLAGWLWIGAPNIDPAMRRAAVVTAGLMCLPCVFCFGQFDLESVSRLSLLLCLPPAIWYLARGLSVARIRPVAATLLAIVLTAVSMPTWGDDGLWIPNWAVSWPAWFMVALAWRHPQSAGWGSASTTASPCAPDAAGSGPA